MRSGGRDRDAIAMGEAYRIFGDWARRVFNCVRTATGKLETVVRVERGIKEKRDQVPRRRRTRISLPGLAGGSGRVGSLLHETPGRREKRKSDPDGSSLGRSGPGQQPINADRDYATWFLIRPMPGSFESETAGPFGGRQLPGQPWTTEKRCLPFILDPSPRQRHTATVFRDCSVAFQARFHGFHGSQWHSQLHSTVLHTVAFRETRQGSVQRASRSTLLYNATTVSQSRSLFIQRRHAASQETSFVCPLLNTNKTIS